MLAWSDSRCLLSLAVYGSGKHGFKPRGLEGAPPAANSARQDSGGATAPHKPVLSLVGGGAEQQLAQRPYRAPHTSTLLQDLEVVY
jgi:hypothetical protein